MPRAGVTKIRKGSAILGQIIDATSETLESGFLWCDGRTIGNASSGATARANADTQELFVHLWTNFADAQAAVSGGRGVSAIADFNANKTIALPDVRGRVLAGKDNMGGSAANRLTSGASGVAGNTIGAVGGAETHTLSTAQLPSHDHTQFDNVGGTGGSNLAAAAAAFTAGRTTTTGTSGSGSAHQNTQPTFVSNKWIRF